MIRSTSMQRLFGGLLMAAMLSCVSMSVIARDIDKKDHNSEHVNVTWTDPAKFTERQYGVQFRQPKPEVWLTEFQKALVKRGDKLLQPGQHLDVTITDVKLAGRIEPWRGGAGGDVRVVKSIYPPQVNLNFTLTGADGQVLDSGERKLRDIAFLDRGSRNRSDAYRFEIRMLQDWLDKEFGKHSGS